LWFQQLSTVSPGTCVETPSAISSCLIIGSWEDLRDVMEKATGVLILCPFNLSKTQNTPPILLQNKVVIVCGTVGECKISGGGAYFRIQRDYEEDGAGITLQGFAFHGATVKAVRVSTPTTFNTPMNTLCSCSFVSNKGNLGAAIQVEERAKLSIHSCLFKKNEAKRGAAIYAIGDINVHNSKFSKNNGLGSCIFSTSTSELSLTDNEFVQDTVGLPIVIMGSLLNDQGGNIAATKTCNGIYNTFYHNYCLYFKASSSTDPSVPAAAPVTPGPTTGTPRGGDGYFNYDPSDTIYGPEKWGNVQDTDEFNRWSELNQNHQHDLSNECSTSTKQGPIDVCNSHAFSGTCNEKHQIRPIHGDYQLDNEHVKMQILPGRLRIKYDTRANGVLIREPEIYTDEFKGTPHPPHADFAHYWNWHMQANHVDIKIPSEHTVCGKRSVGELTIWHLHPEPDEAQRNGQDVIVISILIDIHPQGLPNLHLQKAIDKWKEVFNEDSKNCQSDRKLVESFQSDQYADLSAHSDFLTSDIFVDEIFGDQKSKGEFQRSRRRNYETEEGKNKGWSPYHKEILNSLYFYAYHGSMTEPPCSDFIAWRVMHDPMHISRSQLEQLKDILFNHKNQNCERTSFEYKESVARPVQNLHEDHTFYQCTREDYVSDKEKVYMREITGDPHWCC